MPEDLKPPETTEAGEDEPEAATEEPEDKEGEESEIIFFMKLDTVYLINGLGVLY